jgi:RNA polymerase sigma-70 factor (ECF subfamily)
MKEEMIILLAKEGHEEAFRQLFEMHKEKIYQMAYRYTKSQQDAEDILQETFIKAFKKIKSFQFKNNASFSSWLIRICINLSISYLRKQKRKAALPLSELKNEPVSKKQLPEDETQLKQVFQFLQKALKKLSPAQQIIFDLRHSQHKKIKEIAECMNCSESNIKTQLFRSVAKLKKELGPIWREV